MPKIRNKFAAIVPLVAALLAACLPARGQIIITNFPGVNLTDAEAFGPGFVPPDTMGAAGTNQFVEFINGAFAVYSKAGVRQLLISDSNFWANAGISPATLAPGLTDPRIVYDTASGRWFASELTTPVSANLVLLARSDSANPAGAWKAVSFLANSGSGDFDTLAVDSLGVYVGVNNFDILDNFTGISLFSVPKSDLLAGTPTLTNMTRFENLDADTRGYTPQGVNNSDAGRGHGVMIAIDNLAFNYLDRTTINNPGGAGATLSTTSYIFSGYDGYAIPAIQPGGSTLDPGDDRFSGAIRQIGGYIFMANCILNENNNRDAVHWLVLNETNNAVTSEGIITDPNYDFIFPSIAASHSGRVLLGFNRLGAGAPAGDISIYAALGTMVNGVATMGAPFLLKQGTVSNYHPAFDSSPYRWGDYSATMFDPTDENLVWTIQEIPVSASVWGTQIILLSLATNRPALNLARAGNTVTLSWPLSTDPAYGLQSSTNLVNPATWAALAATPVFSINQNLVTLNLSNRPAFYRLKK
jgi:hypothetical protein